MIDPASSSSMYDSPLEITFMPFWANLTFNSSVTCNKAEVYLSYFEH